MLLRGATEKDKRPRGVGDATSNSSRNVPLAALQIGFAARRVSICVPIRHRGTSYSAYWGHACASKKTPVAQTVRHVVPRAAITPIERARRKT
ncbi:hypothetical protein SBA6_510004 [Candidatus Sulfopaludibacter sp. SbA6]|nr:hypothetical protein SBA6_510004 [Candidatus Sulfopaludibacter sp. SbA6]